MKVVLSGCGADELHGGYPHFNGLNRLYRFGQNLHPTFLPLMMPLVRVLGLYKGRLYQERLQGLLGSIHSLPALVRETRRYFTPQQIQMIYPLAQDLSLCQSDSALEIHPNLEPKTIISLAELTGYLRNILLRDSDWATMANHQELRVPYLGKRYIETVFGIPWAFKQLNQKNKFLLSSQIPDDLTAITKRRKTGFNLDYSVYLTAFLRDIRYTALQHLNQAHGFQLDLDYIDQTLAMGDPNKQARRYWALTSLGFYLYQHG
jgi:asparagine synthase (glutamine-hydrolysing)